MRQPMLFVHGALDREVRLSTSSGCRSGAQGEQVEVGRVGSCVRVQTTARAGDHREVSEHGTLADRNVSKDVTMAVTTG